MKKTIIASAIATTALVATANAQAQGFYIYGEAANTDISSSAPANDIRDEQAQFQQEGDDMNAQLQDLLDQGNTTLADGTPIAPDLSVESSDSSDDSADTSFGLGVGYQFHKNFAAEFGYRDLGDASYKGTSILSGTNASGTINRKHSYESEAFILRGVGILPITERFALEGLLGVAYVDTDYSGSTNVDADGLLQSSKDGYSKSGSDFSATYGVGATYAFNDNLSAYARWERIHDIDTEDEWGGIEADTFSTGIRYHF